MSTASAPDPYPALEDLLADALERIQVHPDELAEAKRRRNAVAAALRKEFSSGDDRARTYVNGSVAHGDALTPLVDVDLGVVVPDPDGEYGPGKKGPLKLKERAADAVRRELKEEFGDLRIEVKGRKRSVLIRFNEPMRPGWDDFTADIIVGLDNPSGGGLYIPRDSTWDRSDPEEHTDLVVDAIERTEVTFARVVRLLKHWLRQFEHPPLCSWHVKALALDSITKPTSLLDGLLTWFRDAAAALDAGPTPDPAGVGPDIKTADPDRKAVAHQLHAAADELAAAIQLEAEGWPALAHDKLADFFDDEAMLPRPDSGAVVREDIARRTRSTKLQRRPDLRPVARTASTGPQVRSWRP